MIANWSNSVVMARVGPSNAPIQQIKAAGGTSRGQGTQGLPQPVSNVSVSVSQDGPSRTLRVSFTQNPNDPYFTSAQLYVQQGKGTPTLIASGVSPIVVTLLSSGAPTILRIVSNGNWGTTPFSTSPGKAISLA